MYKLKKQKLIWLFGLISALTLTNIPALADIAVIANPGIAITKASNNDIKALFLGKIKSLAGYPVTPIEQKSGTTRSSFNNKVLGKSNSRLKAYWTKLLFSGKGVPPRVFPDDAAVKAHVAATPDAIGYIDSSSVDSSVKVILTVK